MAPPLVEANDVDVRRSAPTRALALSAILSRRHPRQPMKAPPSGRIPQADTHRMPSEGGGVGEGSSGGAPWEAAMSAAVTPAAGRLCARLSLPL